MTMPLKELKQYLLEAIDKGDPLFRAALENIEALERGKCYYAHAQTLYGKPQEARDVALLESLGFEVVNPGSAEFQLEMKEAVASWGVHGSQKSEAYMTFCYSQIAECPWFAFRALPDGSLPAGVGGELKSALTRHNNIIELPSLRIDKRMLTVEDTRAWLRETGQR